MSDRYLVRPHGGGFCVHDVWTGEPAVIAMTLQTRLSKDDAEHTAGLLNTRAERGEQKVPQSR